MPRVSAILFITMVVGIAGCQTLTPASETSTQLHDNFAKTWRLYGACRASQSYLDMMLLGTQLLQTASPRSPWSDLVPPALSSVAPQPVRLSVDPKALAADCTLWAARNAEAVGQPGVAQALFVTVLSHYVEPEYAFYVDRARQGLAGQGQPTLRTPIGWPTSAR
jgi:hypothetical protein